MMPVFCTAAVHVLRRSDFDCCDKPKAQDPLDNLMAATKHKVAGCEWDYNLYKETDAVTQGSDLNGDLFFVPGEGPFVKVGTAWGRW
jgi:hypothetical protein